MTIRPEQHGPPEGAARIMSVGLAAALDPFSDPELLGQGKVNLVTLDALAASLGERWPQRRDQVHDYVDRTLQRRIGPQGYHLRISDTDILVCQPDLGRFTGQAACLQALREVFTFFLGDATLADQGVHQITKVSADAVEGRQLRASEVQEGEQAERQASAAPQTGLRTVDRWTPFVASDGRELGVSSSLEPVIELKSFGRIGFRITARVVAIGGEETLTPAAIGKLSRADLLRIDLATAARGLEQMRQTPDAGLQPSLIVPVSFTTLSSQRGRAEMARLLMEARGLVARGVICEIAGAEGVPQGVLLSAVSLIRPYCLFVVAHIHDCASAAMTFGQLARSGLDAVSVACPQGLSDAVFVGWLRATLAAARRVVRSTLLYGVASRGHATLAAQLGATHASLRG